MSEAVPFDFILKSRRVVLPEGERKAAIAVRGSTIAAVLDASFSQEGVRVIDVGDHVVMPGIVDTHAHLNEPGRTEWEGFDTATRACAAGGITTIVDMPLNSIPVTTSVRAFEEKLRAIEGHTWVDHGFWGGVIPGNADELRPLLEAGALGFKAFLVHSGIDDFPHVTRGDLDRAMPILARAGAPLLVHAELEGEAPAASGDPRSYATYLASRPPSWEIAAVRSMVELCRQHRGPVHVVHLSAEGALDEARDARAAGLPFSFETCPHYLVLAAEEVPEGHTEYKCAPPIREKSNRERLWEALRRGDIDFVVSDHSPCTPVLKLPNEGDFMRAWGGIASLQLGLSLIWTEAEKRGFTVSDLARWMCERPAKLAGLGTKKGRIEAGFDADLVVWDPSEEFVVEASMLRHRHAVTPYLGRTLRGAVKTTILRGQTIYANSRLCSQPLGVALLGRGAS